MSDDTPDEATANNENGDASEQTDEPDTPRIMLTDRAAGKVRSAFSMHELDPEHSYLRIRVEPGGPTGMTYRLFTTEEKRDGEGQTSSKDVDILFDTERAHHLDGLMIGWQTRFEDAGFIFKMVNL